MKEKIEKVIRMSAEEKLARAKEREEIAKAYWAKVFGEHETPKGDTDIQDLTKKLLKKAP